MPVANKKFMKDKRLLYSGIAMFTFSSFLLFGQGTASADQSTTSNNQTANTTAVASSATSSASVTLSSVAAQSATSSAVSVSTQANSDEVASVNVVASSSAGVAASAASASQVTSIEAVSAASDSSSTATVVSSASSANVTNLVNPSDEEVIQAKSAAAAAYATTGQVQTINMVASSSSTTTSAFLASIKAGAIQGWVQYGVLPSVTAAQAILESASGTSGLATKGNNLFGIKGSYNGQSITMKTSEWSGSGYYTVYAAFRKYANFSESVLDHGYFLYANSRYSNIIHNRSYTSVANDLHADGYATDPSYASKLINLVQAYGLSSWDDEAFALTDKVNAGNLENVSVNGDTLNVSGWFVATDATGKNNDFVIILDQSTGQEIARYKISATSRPDVQNAYSRVSNSINSGFSISVPYTSQYANKDLTIIFRYSSSSTGDSDFIDHSFTTSLKQNVASLESVNVTSDNQLHIGGWHAADASLGMNYHYIIVLDATTGQELERTLTNSNYRSDVANIYGYVYGAGNSGFNVNIPYTVAMGNDRIQIISRYSSAADGNSNYVDYWFDSVQMDKSDARLDTATISSDGNLNITGWHATDQSIGKGYHYLILFDKTTGTQVGVIRVNNTERDDVAAAYPGIYEESKSGFSGSFNLASVDLTHQLQIVSRYSDSATGNGDSGRYTDFWLDVPTFNSDNEANLESFTFNSGTSISVTGWNATNQALGKKYHYIILFDKTTGTQVGEFLADTQRVDVAGAYPNILNANNSGFNGKFTFSSDLVGHELAIVSRYSDSASGNGNSGNYVDYWFEGKTFTGNFGNVETVKKVSGGITVSGWQATDSSVSEPYRFVIIWDATTGKELTRVKVTTTQRPDVGNYLADIYNSEMSGFTVTIPQLKIPMGDKIQVVSRYSSNANGEGNHTDYWSQEYSV